MVKKGATSENAALQDLFRRHVLCDSKLTPFSSHVKRFPSCLRRACMVGYKHGARTPFQPYGRDHSDRRRLPLPERTHYRRIHSATYPGTPRIQRSFHSPGISQPNPHPIRQGPQRCGPHGDYDARGTVGDGEEGRCGAVEAQLSSAEARAPLKGIAPQGISPLRGNDVLVAKTSR